jgi:hypothetical protein
MTSLQVRSSYVDSVARMSHKDIRSWAASIGTDRPNEFDDLHNGIRRQLV